MRLEPPSLGFTHSAPTSPTHAANILATFAKQQSLSAESICPLELLELLVDDYFTYIHPLLPVPHEPSFRDALQRREDLNSSTFLSLLAAMVGALVVSFPRIAMRRLKALRMESLFPNSTSFIDRCHKVSVEARGTGFLDKCLTVYDAATSYLLALTSTYCFKWRQCKLYFGESLTILRTLGVYKSVDFGNVRKTALSNSLLEDRESQRDFIAREMGRRTFWLVHMGIKSLQQLGASYTEMFIPPPTQTSPYPTLPTEVDDFCIFADSIVSQPSGVVSKIVGFNANVRIFQSYDQLNLINMTHGAAKGANWNQQRHVIEHCLTACKQSMECLPPELMLIKGPETTEFSPSSYAMSPEYNSYDRTSQRDGTRPALMEIERSAQERRKVQYEIQKANIYVTGLATRSHIVEKYWTLCDNSQSRDSPLQANSDMGYNNKAQTRGILLFNPNLDAVQVGYNAIRNQLSGQFQPQTPNNLNHSTTSQSVPIFQQGEVDVAMEREEIVRGLLVVLRSVSQINMEPSGAILVSDTRSRDSHNIINNPYRYIRFE